LKCRCVRRGDDMYDHYMTDRGRVRSVNEDAAGIFYNQANQLLAIVADGMGGHQAGEVASQLAITVAKEEWESQVRLETPQEIETWVHSLMEKINLKIYESSLEKTAYDGMGTTAVITACLEEFVTIAHVGDSRCYIYNDDTFKQVTEDHSLVNELIRTGQISKNDAEKHPRKNVLLRALGTEETTKIDIKTIPWNKGNRLMLCSDGLTNKITEEELTSYVQQKDDIEALLDELIDLANERGGEDNITVALIENNIQHEVGDTSC